MALCLVRGPAFLVGLTPALVFMEGFAALFGYRLALLPRLVLALLPRYPPALLLRRPLKVLKREFRYVCDLFMGVLLTTEESVEFQKKPLLGSHSC